jgi:hypothetical protein
VEKCGTAREATDYNMIWRTHISCWINKATDTDSENEILTVFPWQHRDANAPNYSVMLILMVFLFLTRNGE